MLPFSSFEFFILMGIFLAAGIACKYLMADRSYPYFLFASNAIFLLFVYPKPVHFLLLILFSYLFTYLSDEIFRFKKKIWGILMLLLPMLLVKLDIRFGSYPFELNNLISFAGLSYASFRIMGFYMDKKAGESMPDFFSYFNFLAFTPTLLIGPIDKYSRFKASQDTGFTNINAEAFSTGWDSLVKGIAFKYVLAEIVSRYWLSRYDAGSKDLFFMANNMYAYYLYLFFDFAGYSFMALGLGKMMGIVVPVNFTNPFAAVNPQDFWKRFHISLGDWLKEYFFTPLYFYFSKKKSLKPYPLMRQNMALMLTFLLMGCWNGFKLNYILSGFLFGIFSVVHNSYAVQCRKKGRDIVFGELNPDVIRILSIALMIHLVAFALYVFSGRCPLL